MADVHSRSLRRVRPVSLQAATRASLLLGTALAGGVMFGGGGALAACTVSNTGPFGVNRTVVCSGADTDGVTANATLGSVSVSFDPAAGVANGGTAMTLSGLGGLTFNMNDKDNSITSISGDGVVGNFGGGGTFNASGDIRGAGDAVDLSFGLGSVKVNLDSTSVLNGKSGDGVNIDRTGLGSTTVVADGTILAGDDGIAVSHLAAGDITVTNNGSIGNSVVNTVGGDGIDVSLVGLGKITVTNTKDIFAAGNGVVAGSLGGNVELVNSGDIVTTGAGSAGMIGRSLFLGGDVNMNGAGGTIATAANGGPGMVGLARDDLSILDTGDINSGNAGYDTSALHSVNSNIPALVLSGGVVGLAGGTATIGDPTTGLDGRTITTTGDFGIFAGSLEGSTVNAQGSTINATNGTGIAALAYGGDAVVHSGAIDSGSNGLVLPDVTIGGQTFSGVSASGGVIAVALDGAASVTAHDDIKTTGVYGVFAAASGAVDVDTIGRTITAEKGTGVFAVGGGDVNVQVGAISAGSAGYGLNVPIIGNVSLSGGAIGVSIGGSATVTNSDKISVDGGTFGMAAAAFGDGDATVNVNAAIDPPLIGAASLTVGAGTATTNVNAAIEANLVGAAAVNVGSGNVVVDTTANGAISTDGVGILAANIGDGDTTVTARAPIGGLNNPQAWTGVLVLNALGDGKVSVSTNSDATINASNDGINVTKIFGDGDVTIETRARIDAGDDAIVVNRAFGDGLVSVDARGRIDAGDDGIQISRRNGDGDVNVDFRGYMTAGDDGVNISEYRTDGATNVDVRGVIRAGDEGVQIDRTRGSGDVNVDVHYRSRVIAENGDGIRIRGDNTDGDVYVDVSRRAGVIAENGSAISVNTDYSGGSNDVNISNRGFLIGEGALTTATVEVIADGNVEITNDRFIGTAGGDPAGLAVAVLSGENVRLHNDGYVRGSVLLGSFDLVPPIGTTTFDNHGYWRTSGFSGFGAVGDVQLNNTGYIRATGLTTMGFISGSSNTFDNEGRFDSLGVTTFLMAAPDNANTINNSGEMNVRGSLSFIGGDGLQFNNSGMLDMRDFSTNERTYVSGDFNGNFDGVSGSTMAIDAYLGEPGSQADRLLVGQATTGVTTLVVQDVNGGPGAYNPDGVTFAYSFAGNSQLGDFVLDPTSDHYDASRKVLDKGLFFYDIATRPGLNNPNATAQVLVGLPDSELFETARAITGAQNIWHETTGVWLDRQADLRRQLMVPPPVVDAPAAAPIVRKGYDTPPPPPPVLATMGTGNITPGVWAKTVGSWTNRSDRADFSVLDRSYSFDLGYKQNVFGVLAGVDFGRRGMNNPYDAFVVGAMAGYLTSNLDFKASPNGFDYEGATVGIYGTYVNRGFFVDVLAKADILDMKWKTPSMVGFNYGGASGDATSYGVRIDTGHRFAISPTMFIEPSATLAYVRTDIDTLEAPGATIAFKDGDSLRGALGLRLGANVSSTATHDVEASLTGRVWNEFDGRNKTVVSNLGPTLTFEDKVDGVFGEVAGSINVISRTSGWSGFLNGGVKFNSDLTTTSVKGGVRYVW